MYQKTNFTPGKHDRNKNSILNKIMYTRKINTRGH